MIRLGFGARLFLIVISALVALQVLAMITYFLQRSRDTETGFRLPVPDQTAALVELLEATPKEQWPLVLRAANSTDLRVRLSDGPPQSGEPSWYEAPVVDLILRRYLAALGGRQVRVNVEPSSELVAGPMKALAWASPGSVEIEVGLKTGETLIVTTGGLLTLSLLGFPPGFWAGILGFGIATLTVIMLRREARPLRNLAKAVDLMNLPEKAEPIADAPRSAPEIRALIAAFNRLRERVSGLLQARMVLVSGISHDLRTYAARLRLRAEMIGDESERSKAVRDLDDMSKLLDDSLIAFDATTPPRAQELFEIGPLLQREAEDRRLGGASVSLTMSAAGEPAQVLGDPLAVPPVGREFDGQRHRLWPGGHNHRGCSGRHGGADHRRQRIGHQSGSAREGTSAVRTSRGVAQPEHGRRRPGIGHRSESCGTSRWDIDADRCSRRRNPRGCKASAVQPAEVNRYREIPWASAAGTNSPPAVSMMSSGEQS